MFRLIARLIALVMLFLVPAVFGAPGTCDKAGGPKCEKPSSKANAGKNKKSDCPSKSERAGKQYNKEERRAAIIDAAVEAAKSKGSGESGAKAAEAIAKGLLDAAGLDSSKNLEREIESRYKERRIQEIKREQGVENGGRSSSSRL